jgi:hypothetical protein
MAALHAMQWRRPPSIARAMRALSLYLYHHYSYHYSYHYCYQGGIARCWLKVKQ